MTNSPVTGKRFPLTDAQKAEIEPLKADKNWPEIYRRLEVMARANSAIKPAVPNWYHLATQINQGEGPLANYVRFSMMLAAIRKGQILTPIDFQKASDKLALDIVDGVLKYGIPEDNAGPLIEDVVGSTASLSLKPEDWAGSAANSLKQFPVEWANLERMNQLVAWCRSLPYLDIGTFEGDVFEKDFGKFFDAAVRQNTAAAYSQIYKRPQAVDFYLAGGLEFREAGGLLDGAGSLVPSDDATQLRSPALAEVFGDGDFAKMVTNTSFDALSPEQKTKWQEYLTVLRDDPRIGAAFGVEVASIDRLRLVNEAGVLRINGKVLTPLTPQEATQRQQMASVRRTAALRPPERANPPPTLTVPSLPEAIPGSPSKGGFREGRMPMPGRLPVFTLPALPSKEQIGIGLAFSPPPTLVDDADGPRRVPQRIAPPAPPVPDDAPVTLKQFQEAQDALLLDLRVEIMNRPAPEIDIHALRKKLAREDYLDALQGRTIHSRA
jgi:hypothetical protein